MSEHKKMISAYMSALGARGGKAKWEKMSEEEKAEYIEKMVQARREKKLLSK